MAQNELNQWTITNTALDLDLMTWIEAFLVDRKAQNLSRGTLYFYQAKLKLFSNYCEGQVVGRVTGITPDVIRRYLLFLEENGHNPGGIHAAFRSLKTFLLWFEDEVEPDGWHNPIRKVRAPKVPDEQIEGVGLASVKALIEACKGSAFTTVRDKAALLFLLDTGARASEVCAVNLADVDQVTGEVLIRQGKGRKPRTVYLGQKARRAVRAYLKRRGDNCAALWVTDEHERLTYWGLNEIIKRRAKAAKVDKPGLHDFRRSFALEFLRNGGDIYTLKNLMGHKDLQVLLKYLKQTDADLQAGHAKAGPVDHSDL